MKKYRIAEYKESKEFIKKYMTNKGDFAFIHYACQNFNNVQHENSPRVTSICILFAGSRQIYLFSMASIAERESKDLSLADDTLFDEYEMKLLAEFYSFLKTDKTAKSIKYWLHWNMKDHNYGFEALSQRYLKLSRKKKVPFQIDFDRRVDISLLLTKRYGINYIDHPRLPNLLEMNSIQPLNLMNGQDEAKAFDDKEFIKIDRSIQAKVQAFSEIIERSANSELKTKSKLLKDIYGISLLGILEYVKENAILGIIASLIGGIIVNIICHAAFGW